MPERPREKSSNNPNFKDRYKQVFLSKADPWIIAAAKAWGDTVETFEKNARIEFNKDKDSRYL